MSIYSEFYVEWELPMFVDRHRKSLEGAVGMGLGPMLGCGIWGCAFEAEEDPETVVKFTCDPSEAKAWVAMRDLQWKGLASGAAMVKGVFDVRGDLPCDLYVIVREALSDIDDRDLGDLIIFGLRGYYVGDRDDAIELLASDRRTAALAETLKNLTDLGIRIDDLHLENLGQRQLGQVAIRDGGCSGCTDDPSERLDL